MIHRRVIYMLGILLFMNAVSYTETVSVLIQADITEGDMKPLLGVNGGPYSFGEDDNPPVYEQYQDLGVNMVRTHGFQGPFDMQIIYPDSTVDPSDSANFNFETTDEAFQAAHENGQEIYFRLGNSPNPAYDMSPPLNIPNYIEASKNIIRHYTEGLWDGFEYPLHYVEIWNEPLNNDFWWGTRIEFLVFYEQVAKSLKEEFPEFMIGGPALLPVQYINQDFSEEFVEYCRTNDVPLDFLSWHMYNNDLQVFTGAMDYYRDLLDRNGFTETESHITEWNTGSANSSRYDAQGAAFMSAIWINLQKKPVDLSFIHRGQDSKMNYPEFFGIMYADGTYKKIAYAFKGWSWLMDYPIRVSSDDDADMIETLAGLNDEMDSMGILISHFSQEDVEDNIEDYQLDINGWTSPGSINVKRYAVAKPFDLDLLNEVTYDSINALEEQLFLLPADTLEFLFITQEVISCVDEWTLLE